MLYCSREEPGERPLMWIAFLRPPQTCYSCSTIRIFAVRLHFFISPSSINAPMIASLEGLQAPNPVQPPISCLYWFVSYTALHWSMLFLLLPSSPELRLTEPSVNAITYLHDYFQRNPQLLFLLLLFARFVYFFSCCWFGFCFPPAILNKVLLDRWFSADSN